MESFRLFIEPFYWSSQWPCNKVGASKADVTQFEPTGREQSKGAYWWNGSTRTPNAT